MTIAISRPVMMLKRLIFLRNTAASAVLTLRAGRRAVRTHAARGEPIAYRVGRTKEIERGRLRWRRADPWSNAFHLSSTTAILGCAGLLAPCGLRGPTATCWEEGLVSP